jgi:hypothetical protein
VFEGPIMEFSMFITVQVILYKKEHKSLKICVDNEGDFVEK